MKIADSAIQLVSSHTKVEHHERRETLVAWQQNGEREQVSGEKARGKDFQALAISTEEESAKVSFSEQAKRNMPVTAVAAPLNEEDLPMASLNMRILKAMFEKLTGHKIKFSDPDQLRRDIEAAGNQQEAASPEQGEVAPVGEGEPPESVGWGVAYDYYESHYEYESTSFAAAGVIKTEDGREIDFSVELNMSREFMSEQQISLRAGDALKDPLVINFDGAAAELTQTKFSFDIDADGRADQISFVGPGSGFLALDKNGDQTINDGSELFGALTGNGFAELAAYDEDNNGWIDENDSVYDSLRIWSKSSSGEDQLMALGSRGVGAVYLGHIDTPFALKDADNNLQGQVRSSGVFLHEDGQVGTVQQLDLVT
jgi:hypothetical protein